jgi:hypothetical protein
LNTIFGLEKAYTRLSQQTRNSSTTAGKMQTISCLARIRSKHHLPMKPQQAEVVVDAGHRPPEEAKINEEEVNRVEVEGVHLVVGVLQLTEDVVILPEQAVVEVAPPQPKTGTYGYILFNIFEPRTFFRLASSFSPRSGARRTLKHCLTSIIALQQKRARFI